MGLLGRALKAGRTSLLLCCCLLLCIGSVCLAAQAEKESYPIVYGIDGSKRSSYIELKDASGTYEVASGDCLWTIAEKLWKDGRKYAEILKANEGLIKEPDLIYPGMLLQVEQTGYIRKDKNSGVETPQYRFGTPDTWKLVYLEEGGQYANFALSGDGLCYIACQIRDKEENIVQTTQDWDDCCGRILDYVEAQYPDAVSDLTFEHYLTGESDELYLYSYVYEADLTEFGIKGGGKINVCAGLKLTEHIQAEFIGFAYGYDIHGAVRYVAADFEEHPASSGYSSVNGSNMTISPSHPWELEGMFNPFPWVEGFVDDVFRSITNTPPKDWSTKDELLDGLHRFKGRNLANSTKQEPAFVPDAFELVGDRPFMLWDGAAYCLTEDNQWERYGNWENLVRLYRAEYFVALDSEGKIICEGYPDEEEGGYMPLCSGSVAYLKTKMLELNQEYAVKALNQGGGEDWRALLEDNRVMAGMATAKGDYAYQEISIEGEKIADISGPFALTESGKVYKGTVNSNNVAQDGNGDGVLELGVEERFVWELIDIDKSITAIYAGQNGKVGVGLSGDGTAVLWSTEKNSWQAGLDLSTWKNVSEVSVGSYYVVGLTFDGKVLYADSDAERETRVNKLLQKKKHIAKIACAYEIIALLNQDGTVEMVQAAGN